MRPLRILLIHASAATRQTLSYWSGWPRYFRRLGLFEAEILDVGAKGRWREVRLRLKSLTGRFDAIVVLHSVFSNSCELKGRMFEWVAAARPPKAFFIGNEYKLMPEKMAFCERLDISLLVTMNPSPRAHQLYRERLGCRVVCIPNAGLDPEIFRPSPISGRPIDIGYRAFESPLYLGHAERREIATFFVEHGGRFGLKTDISLDPKDRFDEAGWAQFLNRCKGQLGTEAGGDYFELTDSIRLKVNEFLEKQPDATLRDLRERFFETRPDPVPVRTISGRHVEAAGTKTIQILFEGYYNGYLKPDEHYIPLKKDFSNVDEAIAKFRDETYCGRLTQNAYDLVHQELTYEKLIDKFHEALRQVL